MVTADTVATLLSAAMNLSYHLRMPPKHPLTHHKNNPWNTVLLPVSGQIGTSEVGLKCNRGDHSMSMAPLMGEG